jgi:uncharacterized protein YigE (DUF2233 family)
MKRKPSPTRCRGRLIRWTMLLLAATALTACAHPPRGVSSHEVEYHDAHFRVVTIDLARVNLGLHWRDPVTGKPFGSIRKLQQWGAQHGRRLVFATNAGIYGGNGAPLGLYVENGKLLEPLNTAHGDPAAGNFSLQPNGVFSIDNAGRASVQTTAAFAAQHHTPRIATQSGPMLVVDGKINPHFIADSTSRKWRDGVCARNRHTAVFAASTDPVNFHTFAALFRNKLGCRNALYLDVTLSQIYVGNTYYGAPAFLVKPYAGMFAVFVPVPAH